MKYYFHTSLILCAFLFPLSLYGQDSAQIIKDELKKEKRFVHPHSKFITVSGGLGFTSTLIKSNSDFVSNGMLLMNNTYLPSIMYEHGLKNGFFMEFGYDYVGNGVSYRTIIRDSKNMSYTSITHMHNLVIGGLYRIKLKNNFNLLNIHSGLVLGVSNKTKLQTPFSNKSLYFDSSDNYYNSVTQNIEYFNPFSIGIYFGISKDIRLSEEVFIFIRCTGRTGFNTQFSGTFVTDTDKNEVSTFKVRGDNLLVTLGLKILLNKKYLENGM